MSKQRRWLERARIIAGYVHFQLLQASVPQQDVRKIVRLDLARVTRIGKLVNLSRKRNGTA